MGTILQARLKIITKNMPLNLNITCHFCFENFEIFLDPSVYLNTEIWDCEVCCNPNKVSYLIKDNNLFASDLVSATVNKILKY